MKALLVRVYGFSDHFVSNAPISKFMAYYNCIEAIEARESLIRIEEVSYPNMKRQDATKIFRKKQKSLRDVIKRKSVTFGEMFKNVKGRLNG